MVNTWENTGKIFEQISRKLLNKMGIYGARRKLRFLIDNDWKYKSILGFTEIHGYLHDNEAMKLYALALSLPQIPPPIIVEIGCFVGKSSVVLGTGLKTKKGAKMYCIDPFDATEIDFFHSEFKNISGSSLQGTFENNIKKNGLLKIVHILAGKSNDMIKRVNDDIDLLFIDGDHEYYAVLNDFENFAPKVKSGGFVVLHDVYSKEDDVPEIMQGPRRVAEEKLYGSSEWAVIDYIGSLLVAQKK